MKKGMNQVQKILLLMIGVLTIALAAVLAAKGYEFYQEKQQEKEWKVRHQEVQEEIDTVRVQIEELAGNADELQAFLDEQVNLISALDERQAEEQNFTGQEDEQESEEQGSVQDSTEGRNETQNEVQEVSSGAIVISMEEIPQTEQGEQKDEQAVGSAGEYGEEGQRDTGDESSIAEVNPQGVREAAEGAIIIEAPPAPKPSTEKKDKTVSGNASNDEKEEDTVSGNGVKAEEEDDTVSGNGVKEVKEEDTVSGNGVNEVEEDTVSGNGINEVEEEDTVSGNGVNGVEEEDTVSGNGINEIEEDTVSGNELNGVDEAETISGNAVVNGQVIPFVSSESEPTLEQRRSIRSSYLETMQTNGEDKAFISNNYYDFSDIKIACLGDSITEGSNLDKMENYQQYSYPSVLKNILQAEEVYNLGIGGSSYGRYWENAFVDRYKEIPKDTDIIIVMGGVNDGFAASEKELGSLEEKKARTFYGDVDELMRGLRKNYPDAKVIFATPLPNVLHDYLRAQRNYLLPQSVYVDAIKKLAAQYQIEVIDLYNSNLLDTHDAQIITQYMPDGVHGNPAGYQVLAEHMAKNIIEIVQRDGINGTAYGEETVSGNGIASDSIEDMVSENAVEESVENTISGNGIEGNHSGIPERTLTPEEAKRLEEERIRAEKERIAREREEAAKAAENNKKVAADAVIVPPAQENQTVETAPTQTTTESSAEGTKETEVEKEYEYSGEAIVIQ